MAGAALVVVVGLSLSVDQAWAQARDESVTGRIRPEYDPLGLPLDLLFWETGRVFSPDTSRPREGQTALGSFIVYPSLSTELEFTDNVYDEENGQDSDFIFRTTPLVRLESDWDNHFLAVEGGLTYGKYFSQSSEDYIDLLAATDFRIDVAEEVLVNGRLEWRQGHESRGDADDPGAAFDVTVLQRWGGELSATYDGIDFDVTPGYSYFFLDYDDVSGPGGTINNDDRDRAEQRAFVRFSYQVAEGLSAFVEPSANWIDYDTSPDDEGFNRDSNGYAVLAGLQWDPDEVWEVRGAIGYQYQTYDDARFGDISGVTYSGEVLWNADELTTVTAALRRDIEQVTLTDSAGKINDQFDASVDREILPNWIATAEGFVRREDYDGIDRTDYRYGGGLSTDYYLGENVVIGAGVFHDRRDSDVANESFATNRVILSLLLRM